MKANMRGLQFVCLFLIGCTEVTDDTTPISSNGAPEAGSSTNTEPQTKSPNPVTVRILSWKETQQFVAKQKGKVVVLDLWSTSCVPCLREFPHLVELHKTYDKDKVVCLSASCDYEGIQGEPPESYRDNVLKFLKKQNATFDNILLNVESDELFETIELASIPAVYVFDRDGKIKKRFDNDEDAYGEEGFSYKKHIIPLVEELLTDK